MNNAVSCASPHDRLRHRGGHYQTDRLVESAPVTEAADLAVKHAGDCVDRMNGPQ